MARTIVGLNDPKALKRYSAFLAVDTARVSYWNKKFMGVGEDSPTPVQILPHLEQDAGENITFDLSMQLKQEPVEGDDIQEGTEEDLKFYTDGVFIDQARGGVNTGGRMTRKRTIHKLRKLGRKRQSEWWGRVFDELFFMYGSGARGINADFIYRTTFSGRANNPLQAPDSDHVLFGGDATSKATITAADKFDLKLVDRAKTKATMMGGGTEGMPEIQPIKVDGEDHFCIVMNPWQEFDLRTTIGEGKWLDLQKAAMGAEGRKNPVFRGSLGMHNNVILHSHKGAIRFDDYGVGSDIAAGRGLFLGRQAMVCAFGSPGTGMRFDWHEESRDNGNQAVISTSAIFGIKKTRFDDKDFGVMAMDTACADPG